MSRITLVTALGSVGALALGSAGSATGAANPSAELGQHVAACAQEHLPEGARGITCSHDGMAMSFENFGAMVRHMQQHDC